MITLADPPGAQQVKGLGTFDLDFGIAAAWEHLSPIPGRNPTSAAAKIAAVAVVSSH